MQNFGFFPFLNERKTAFFAFVFCLFFSSFSFAAYRDLDTYSCPVDVDTMDRILLEVEAKNPQALSSLSRCLQLNHKLIFQACLIDPAQLEKALPLFREDENFVYRLLKVNPEILKYAAKRIRSDQTFVERATLLNRDALKYADPKLLNNFLFMQRMITIDSYNYIYASKRLQEVPEFATIALQDDGMLLAYAPASVKNNKTLVKIAVKSNVAALEFANFKLKSDPEIVKLIGSKNREIKRPQILEFLVKNYYKEEEKRNVGLMVDKKARIFKKNCLIDRNYISKWQRHLKYTERKTFEEELNLIAADSRNYPPNWKEDLAKYPDLIKKIEKFFNNRQIDKEAINNLSLTYLWKVKDAPLTLAFNLYLLRESSDEELGPNYANVTSLSAIATKINENGKANWKLTVLEVIFDADIKVNLTYPNGHKAYIVQDLYKIDKKDKTGRIIYRVEDKYNEYFEIYTEQKGGKYKLVYRIDPLKDSPFLLDKTITPKTEIKKEIVKKKIVKAKTKYDELSEVQRKVKKRKAKAAKAKKPAIEKSVLIPAQQNG